MNWLQVVVGVAWWQHDALDELNRGQCNGWDSCCGWWLWVVAVGVVDGMEWMGDDGGANAGRAKEEGEGR